MPTIPAMLPSDRFFAHLEKFQCACPSCGRLLVVAPRKHEAGKRRSLLLWNPVTQRLRCSHCHGAFAAGLVLYPTAPHTMDPPPDTVRTRQERMELRRVAGGWCSEAPYESGAPVNLSIAASCCCPARGWSADCPLHGTPHENLTPTGVYR
jgi:hypothetical protein